MKQLIIAKTIQNQNRESFQNKKTSLSELKEFIQTLTYKQLNAEDFLDFEQLIEYLSWINTHIHGLVIDENADLNQRWTIEGKEYALAHLLFQLISCHITHFKYNFPPYMDFLLKFNLAEPYKNFTGWNLLCDYPLQKLMTQLLKKGYLPEPEILNSIIPQGELTGITAWHWLITDYMGLNLPQKLLDKGIYPSAQAMNSIRAQGRGAGTSAWFFLAGEKGHFILQQLFDKGIYPSPQSLNAICSEGLYTGTTAWHWLSLNEDGRSIIQQLLKQEIYPSAQALNSICAQGANDGLSAWFGLTVGIGPLLLQQLFNQGIYPSKEAMNAICVQKPNKGMTVWHSLAQRRDAASFFIQLFDKGIYPDIDYFSTVIKGYHPLKQIINSPIICTFIAKNIRLAEHHLTPLLIEGYELVGRFKKINHENNPQLLEEMYQASNTWVKAFQTENIFKETDVALVIFWNHLNISLDNYHKAIMNCISSESTHFPYLWNRAALTFLKNKRWQYLLDTLPYVSSTMRYEKKALGLLAQINTILDEDLKQVYLKAGLLLSLQVENKEMRLFCSRRMITALVENKAVDFNYVIPTLVENLIKHLNALPLAERQSYKIFSGGLFYQIEQLKIIIQHQLEQLKMINQQQSQLTLLSQKMDQLYLMLGNRVNSENLLSTTLDSDKVILNSFKNNHISQQEENLTSQLELKKLSHT